MNSIGELWIGEVGGVAAIGAGDPGERIPSSVSAIRARVRFGDDGKYRPLAGARGLPGGWYVPLTPDLPLDAAVEAVYPLALTHRRQFEAGTLRVVTLDEVLSRQSGRYESSGSLSPAGRTRIREVLCGEVCVRVPVWATEQPEPGEIPCPEPCSVLVALAREAAIWEAEPPQQEQPDPAIEFADFETPGNVVRETYLRRAREEATT